MQCTQGELRLLAARAAPLHERWRGHFLVEATDGPQLIEDRLRRWRQALSVDGDPALLARRAPDTSSSTCQCNTDYCRKML